MQNLQKVAEKWCKLLIILLTGACIFYLLLLSMWSTSESGLRNFSDDVHNPSIFSYNYFLSDHPLMHLISIVLLIAFLLSFKKIYKYFTVKINKELFFWKYKKEIIYIFYFFIGLMFILNTKLYPISDQQKVLHIAEQMLQSNFESFQPGGYMHRYPYQNGIVLFCWVMTKIFGKNNYIAIQVFNLIIMNITFYMIGKISYNIWKKNSIVTVIRILYIMFLPVFFYITLVYGTIPGWGLSVISMYYLIKFLDNRKVMFGIIAAILIGTACMFKTNSMILLAAMVLVLMFECIINQKHSLNDRLRLAACIIIIIGTYFLCGIATDYCMEKITKIPVGKGIPKVTWVAMSLQDGIYAPGVYNGYTVELYDKCGYDYEMTNEMASENLKETLKRFKNDKSFGLQLIGRKMAAQWNNPSFQGLSIINNREMKAGAEQFINGLTSGKISRLLFTYMNHMQTYILTGSLCYFIFKGRKISIKELLLSIGFLGGFIFHIFWEANAIYTLPYFLLLIPYSVNGFKHLLENIEEFILNSKNVNYRNLINTKIIIVIGIMILLIAAIFIVPNGKRAFSYTIAIREEADILSQYNK